MKHDNWYEITLDMDIQEKVVKTTRDLFSDILKLQGAEHASSYPGASDLELEDGTGIAGPMLPGDSVAHSIEEKTPQTRQKTEKQVKTAGERPAWLIPVIIIVVVIIVIICFFIFILPGLTRGRDDDEKKKKKTAGTGI
ncbi:hypothetical protein K7I13_04770 [Brucepastera parasyntrophica]|uniref:hypothetical protein n=1 Tax=Brucepastera parasyntrophica TaxID=2880008 RepID=UPI00210BCB44|nr:hypothetical protein [Brucepastera parasyntrophica]ULQ60597.1 hypothetical protein K7I13_04770 [Brucepastera parasyntrophica]